jgi:hypothetical protein
MLFPTCALMSQILPEIEIKSKERGWGERGRGGGRGSDRGIGRKYKIEE